MGYSSLQPLSSSIPADGSIIPSAISTSFGGFSRNKLVNGDFSVVSRGTSFTTPTTGAYTFDTWRTVCAFTVSAGTFVVSQQAFPLDSTDVVGKPRYFARWSVTSAATGGTNNTFQSYMEDANVLAGRVVNVSFWAKADSARAVSVWLARGYGIGGSAGAASSSIKAFDATLSTSWQKFSASVVMPDFAADTVVEANSFSYLEISLPINTTMTIDIANVQVEIGGETPFEVVNEAVKRAACERFYQILPMAVGSTLTNMPFRTAMAKIPTITGGGSGFTSSNLTAYSGTCLQTTGAFQTLILNSDLY